jgi:hypothetical protein
MSGDIFEAVSANLSLSDDTSKVKIYGMQQSKMQTI